MGNGLRNNFIDVVHYKTIRNRELVEHIDRVGKVIYSLNINANVLDPTV
jgi:hypothetical protein